MRIVHIGEESLHIFRKTWGMSMKFSGTPSPLHSLFRVKQMTWFAVSTLLIQYCMIAWYSMIFQRHIQNPDKQRLLQIFTRNSNFFLDWPATTLHSFKMLHSVSLGQTRIGLAIPNALKIFPHSEEGRSPSSLKSFGK